MGLDPPSKGNYVTAPADHPHNLNSSLHDVGAPLAQPQPAPLPAFYRLCGCIECYNPSREVLEYDYTYDDATGKKPPQNYPRIRERGEYYIDSYNGEPWSCSFGTAESVGISDVLGMIDPFLSSQTHHGKGEKGAF